MCSRQTCSIMAYPLCGGINRVRGTMATCIDDARRRRQKAESAWRRTKLEVHRQIFVAARDECNNLITQRKTRFYLDKLQYADNKSIFQIVGSLSGKPPPSYPDYDLISECVNTFPAYFTGKISEIRNKLHGANSQCDTPLSETKSPPSAQESFTL